MSEITFTEVIEQLKLWQQEASCDINSTWIEDNDKRQMQQQLQQLIIATGNLELIATNEESQIFRSSITFK